MGRFGRRLVLLLPVLHHLGPSNLYPTAATFHDSVSALHINISVKHCTFTSTVLWQSSTLLATLHHFFTIKLHLEWLGVRQDIKLSISPLPRRRTLLLSLDVGHLLATSRSAALKVFKGLKTPLLHYLTGPIWRRVVEHFRPQRCLCSQGPGGRALLRRLRCLFMMHCRLRTLKMDAAHLNYQAAFMLAEGCSAHQDIKQPNDHATFPIMTSSPTPAPLSWRCLCRSLTTIFLTSPLSVMLTGVSALNRSEERRVGKECPV